MPTKGFSYKYAVRIYSSDRSAILASELGGIFLAATATGGPVAIIPFEAKNEFIKRSERRRQRLAQKIGWTRTA